MKKTRISKRIFALFLSLMMIFSLAACGGETESSNTGNNPSVQDTQESASDVGNSQAQENEEADSSASEGNDSESSGSSILVAYFSHTGENYNVGVIEKGNTHIIADMIAEETGADLFEIATVNPYPETYDECTDVAKQEQEDNARPEIIDPPTNLDGYDTIFIGYPIWWGDLPMAVYTFLESYDFSGKTVIPFCTHEGSGLSGTQGSIEAVCSGATVLDGLAIRGSVAQNEQDEAKIDVQEWLDGLNLAMPTDAEMPEGGKTLVVYFSATNNTEAVAGYIAEAAGGDLYELIPVEPYTDDDLNYNNDDSRVSREHDDPALRVVELTNAVPDHWEDYDTVFIGYPIWWGIAAWPVDGFISANDFTGKTVIPFCTSGSSGIGESGELLKEAAGTGNWLDGERFQSHASEETVREWVNGLELS